MIKKAFPWLSILLAMALLLVAVPLPGAQAEADAVPDVNGIVYGDGDINLYEIWGYLYAISGDEPPYCAPGEPLATLYGKVSGTMLYVAVVESRCINDNVFGDGEPPAPGLDTDYLESAQWVKVAGGLEIKHTFYDLDDSDMVEFQLTCLGDESGGYVWQQDYLYYDDSAGVWKSDALGDTGGGGAAPDGIVSSSSMAWNMSNTEWDVTLDETRTCTQNNCDWKSPDSPDIGITGVVTDEIGYPETGPITYDTRNVWEWPIVYEWSVDLESYCPSMQFETFVVSSHNSPTKGGGEDPVPLSVDLLYFTAEGGKKSVVLNWATSNEVDNLGFTLWRAQSLDGEKVQVNDEIIPSQVPPAGGGAVYEYTDTKLKNDTTYYYWLQDVDIYGNTGWSDPAEATTIKPGRDARR